MTANATRVLREQLHLVTLLAVFLCPTASDAGSRVLALTGQEAPGTNATFYGAPGVSLNDQGDVAIFASIKDAMPSVSVGPGLWTEVNGGGLQLVSVVGNRAPGFAPNVLLETMCCGGQINNVGQVVFQGQVTRTIDDITLENNRAVWVGTSDQLRRVARSGDNAVGVSPLHTFQSFSAPLMNNTGQLVWYSQLEPGVDAGLWSEGHGLLHLLASNTVAPVPSPGWVPFSVVDSAPLNDAGDAHYFVAYKVHSDTPDEQNAYALWLDQSDGPQLIAATGTSAPGAENGAVFEGLGQIGGLNNASHVSFNANMRIGSGGVTPDNDGGIWAGSIESLHLIAREGDPAPGVPGVSAFRSLGGTVINHAGQVLFSAQTQPSLGEPPLALNSGIWKHDGGHLTLVARDGQQAAGANDGEVYAGFDLLSINSSGQSIFRARAGRPEDLLAGEFWTGLWAEDAAGSLKLIVRDGSQIDVDNGPGVDLRTVMDFTYAGGSGGEDGRPRGFNAQGQIAFTAYFTDGSAAAVVTNAVAVPEPCLNTFAIGTLTVAIARLRRR